jgi:hypothetical protein
LPQAVHFAASHSGYSKRICVMSRNTPVAAGTSEAPMNGIDQVVGALAGSVEAAGLLPEAVDVGDLAVAFRQLLEHHRQAGGLVAQVPPCRAD